MTPRAITGFGIVRAVGTGRELFFEAMRHPTILGDEPLCPPETFDASPYPHAAVAEVKSFDATKYLGDKGLRTLDRLTKLLVVSARLALHDSGFKKDNVFVQGSAERIGLCTSNAYGSLEAIVELDRVAAFEDARYINPAKFPNTVANSAAGYVSIWEDLRALNVAVSDGNCGALDAVACADVFLEAGRAEALLVGGAEAMSEPLFVAFQSLGAIDQRSRLGEAAVLFAMETEEHARARGATVLADVTGYGTSFMVPEGEAPLIQASAAALERAMRSALEDAQLDVRDVDLVVSGISGLEVFDVAERAAIAEVLGPDACVVAPKAIFGETLGACGAMGMASALAYFAGGVPKPLLSGVAPERPRTALVTSMGFYGNASAVVLRRPATPTPGATS